VHFFITKSAKSSMGRRREPGWLTDGNVVVGVTNSTEVLRVTAGASPGPSTSPSYKQLSVARFPAIAKPCAYQFPRRG
jgi:hypothetical protein